MPQIFNKILIVDDDSLHNLMTSNDIKTTGLCQNVKSIHNGFSGIEYLKACEEGREDDTIFPDLILLNLDMPVMNGYEFCARFDERFAQKHPGTKIIIMTNSFNIDEKKKSLSSQSVINYLVKPADLEDVLEMSEIHVS